MECQSRGLLTINKAGSKVLVPVVVLSLFIAPPVITILGDDPCTQLVSALNVESIMVSASRLLTAGAAVSLRSASPFSKITRIRNHQPFFTTNQNIYFYKNSKFVLQEMEWVSRKYKLRMAPGMDRDLKVHWLSILPSKTRSRTNISA